MANKLTYAEIVTLLAKDVSALKPGELDDLRAVLDTRNAGVGGNPDSSRAIEHTLNALLLSTTTTSTTSTTTTSTTTTTTTSTSTTTTTTTTSDRRLKRNIRLLANMLGLGIYSYNFVGSTKRSVGMMAQEVYEKYPEAVIVGGDDPFVNPWKINYGKLFKMIGAASADQLRAFLAIRTAAA